MRPFLVLLLSLLLGQGNTLMAQDAVATEDFYDVMKVREIQISFSQDNWAYLLDSLRIHGDKLLLGTVNLDGQRYENVGIRYRGSKSFKTGSKRNAFHIKLNYIDKQQNHLGYKTLKMSNSLRDPSMVREVMSYEIARQYMPAPKANYAKLSVNGEYYGLFVNLEAVDAVFLEKNYGSNQHSFFKCSPSNNYKNPEGCKKNTYASLEYEGSNAACYLRNYELKSESGWDDLIQMTRVLAEEPDNIGQVLNVDRTLWMLAFNNVLVNLSSYSGQNSQNYYLYKDEKGQFNPIIWDLNLSFGSFKNIGKGSDLSLKELQKLDPLLHEDNATKPLISVLLKDPFYKKVYLSHIRTILYDHFLNDAYEKRARELQQLITVPLHNDPNRLYENFNDFNDNIKKTIGKRSKIPGIVELMASRSKFLKKHPAISYIPPTVEEVKVLRREKFSSKMVETFQIQAKVDKLPKRVKLYYRFDSEDAFKEVYMADDGR
ncbi:MAG: CotH kinase family protein, partial [Bacteroidota bacterium]